MTYTMTAIKSVFIDTNVLVYATVATAPMHLRAKQALESLWADGVNLWISRQVLREYVAVVTRPQTFALPLTAHAAADQVSVFMQRFFICDETDSVTQRLLDLLRQIGANGRQVHDANIVASMLANAVNQLITYNTADFARYAHLITLLDI